MIGRRARMHDRRCSALGVCQYRVPPCARCPAHARHAFAPGVIERGRRRRTGWGRLAMRWMPRLVWLAGTAALVGVLAGVWVGVHA